MKTEVIDILTTPNPTARQAMALTIARIIVHNAKGRTLRAADATTIAYAALVAWEHWQILDAPRYTPQALSGTANTIAELVVHLQS